MELLRWKMSSRYYSVHGTNIWSTSDVFNNFVWVVIQLFYVWENYRKTFWTRRMFNIKFGELGMRSNDDNKFNNKFNRTRNEVWWSWPPVFVEMINRQIDGGRASKLWIIICIRSFSIYKGYPCHISCQVFMICLSSVA